MITFRGVRPYYGDDAFLTSCKVRPIPEIEHETVIIPSRPGVLTVSKMHRARMIEVSFELLGHSAEKNAQIAESISVWAETTGDERFIFDETPDRFYLAKLVDSSDVDYAEECPTLDLSFICVNPYAYSIDLKAADVGETIIYQGTVATWPCIRFTPETDTNAPTWTDGKRTISFDSDYTAAAGHEIVIDCANKRCTDNGVSIMQYLSISSDWLVLERFENKIDGSGGRVEWRNAYL